VAPQRKTITALREQRGGRVDVELDGAPWRTFPVAAVVRAGLGVGTEVDRERARLLSRERRRSAALTKATRALQRRDLSERALDDRLERAGVAPAARTEALATLARAGVVDDARFAIGRADALARRGRGDEAIRWELERHGIEPELVARALASIEPELERAEQIVSKRGRTFATARLLTRNGFDADAVATVVPSVGNEA
jgi:SOS response regulatory protein OraA/RecX